MIKPFRSCARDALIKQQTRSFQPLGKQYYKNHCRFYGSQTSGTLQKSSGDLATETSTESSSARAETDGLEEVIDILCSKSLAWSHAGESQFDFRSDVVTRPNLSMLRAILKTTLLDDVYREDPTTTSLENHIATMTGKSAGIFVLSGTMANQVALRALLTQPPHAVLCDARAHIIHWEAGGLASLCGAMVQTVAPSNGEFLILEDIQGKVVLSDDVHKCPTRVIALENTISGLIHPVSELQRISQWARKNYIKLHLDGARLWEAVAAGGGTLKEYAECFDSVTLDFSKGLGAPMGAIIVGGRDFIAQTRRIRKSIGGGMRQAGVLSAAARAAVEEMFPVGDKAGNYGKRLRDVHKVAQSVAEIWVRHGGRLLRRSETNIIWVDLERAGVTEEKFREIGARCGIKLEGCRIVLHCQISREGLRRLNLVFKTALKCSVE